MTCIHHVVSRCGGNYAPAFVILFHAQVLGIDSVNAERFGETRTKAIHDELR
jgi:hypothetical protein